MVIGRWHGVNFGPRLTGAKGGAGGNLSEAMWIEAETSRETEPARRAIYGLDAPGVVKTLFGLGAACLSAAGALLSWRWYALGIALLCSGCSLMFSGLGMIYMSRVGKLRMRDRLLDLLTWRGDERVLDVGCGRGLMLIGAAKRLTTGTAVGVDIWSERDLSGNSADATRRNAEAEGVGSRVEVMGGDARSLPFADGSFDVVLSSTVLHNIEGAAERARAVREIARVLRPGGRAVVSDIRHLSQYGEVLREAGLEAAVVRRGLSAVVVPLFTMGSLRPGHVVATKL